MSEVILLTGATGFVGQALLSKWLRDSDARLALLVRGRRDATPEQRVEGALRDFTRADPAPWMERIETFNADVSVPGFGLSSRDTEGLTRRVTHVVHCAAAARFDLDLDEARRTNVGGPRNILEFAAGCPRLRRIDYIGTAYVAGRRAGLVLEDELDAGQEHRNTYERSKFEAETMVREWTARLPISILRPSIVVCDSRTGYASNHNGFYRALRMYLKGGLTALPGFPTSQLDLVPVDYVADAAFALAQTPRSIGACYHLAAGPARSTTLGEVRELAARHSGLRPFDLIPPERFSALAAQMAKGLPPEGLKALNEMQLYMPYLLCEHQFDSSRTVRDTGMQAPEVGDYFAKFVEFILHAT